MDIPEHLKDITIEKLISDLTDEEKEVVLSNEYLDDNVFFIQEYKKSSPLMKKVILALNPNCIHIIDERNDIEYFAVCSSQNPQFYVIWKASSTEERDDLYDVAFHYLTKTFPLGIPMFLYANLVAYVPETRKSMAYKWMTDMLYYAHNRNGETYMSGKYKITAKKPDYMYWTRHLHNEIQKGIHFDNEHLIHEMIVLDRLEK